MCALCALKNNAGSITSLSLFICEVWRRRPIPLEPILESWLLFWSRIPPAKDYKIPGLVMTNIAMV